MGRHFGFDQPSRRLALLLQREGPTAFQFTLYCFVVTRGPGAYPLARVFDEPSGTRRDHPGAYGPRTQTT